METRVKPQRRGPRVSAGGAGSQSPWPRAQEPRDPSLSALSPLCPQESSLGTPAQPCVAGRGQAAAAAPKRGAQPRCHCPTGHKGPLHRPPLRTPPVGPTVLQGEQSTRHTAGPNRCSLQGQPPSTTGQVSGEAHPGPAGHCPQPRGGHHRFCPLTPLFSLFSMDFPPVGTCQLFCF